MATLSDVVRKEIWTEFMGEMSRERIATTVGKADLRAAINALDAFMDANAAAINNAIPAAARSALTIKQKAMLLMYVITRRYLAG
jgi:hypothetical protein